ncbi:hypothetical protein LCGC14_0847760 [marine sediment metagenome]|uniref:Uncharacterized protein n=1 Tax=marine sediment metagenome TaxID=412755 RepID=A0A0F9RW29_9ZZZZ|nr:hypothetical protein [bacterium]
MTKKQLHTRKCGDCEKEIPFQGFLRENPTIDNERGRDLFDSPIITVYCTECFLKRPEKPYKTNRRYYYQKRYKKRDHQSIFK